MNGIVEVEDLWVRLGGRWVLEGVHLQVEAGEFVGLLGPNGAGKTTLLRVLLGLTPPTRGRVRVLGRDPRRLGRDRSRIGYVPQTLRLDPRFPIRVRDVVAQGRYARVGLGRRLGRVDRKAVQEALAEVGMLEWADAPFPRLSGGQRQRVLVARALAAEPELLLLDEPTSHTDPTATESLYELLGRLHRRGLTLLVVSHDVGVVARHVTRVACLNRTLVAHGRPQEVLTRETLEEMYGCEALYFLHGDAPHMVVGRDRGGKGA